MAAASLGEMWKKSGSNRSTASRNPPQRPYAHRAQCAFRGGGQSHAAVAPGGPADRDGTARALAGVRQTGALGGEGVQEGVGAGVVALARVAPGGGGGRAQREEVQRLV